MRGSIYVLCAPNLGIHYIGSTTLPVCDRVAIHKSNYRRWLRGGCEGYISCKSYQIFRDFDWSYDIIESGEYEDKKSLLRQEAMWMRCEEFNCVNKSRNLGIENMRQYLKRYYQDNKHKTIVCECGEEVSYYSLAGHKKSKRHINRCGDETFDDIMTE